MYREIYHDGCNGWRLGDSVSDPTEHLIKKYGHSEQEAHEIIVGCKEHCDGIIQCDEEGICLLIPC